MPVVTAVKRTSESRNLESLAVRTIVPVKWFAAIGSVAVLMQVYVYGRWVLSGNMRGASSGPDEIPAFMRVAAHAHEIIGIGAAGIAIYWYVVRPLRRGEGPGLPAYLIPGVLSMEWLNLSANYFNHAYTWNTAFLSWGSWYQYIPGWVSPRAEMIPEPIVFAFPGWIYAVLVPCVLFAGVLRAAKRRWPRLGTAGLLLVAFAITTVFDLVLEIAWVRLGLYAFTGTLPDVTLFAGHYYQFPLYEPLLLCGLLYVPITALIYFRDDKGYTIAERGVERLGLTPGKTAGLRVLALTGFCNIAIFAYSLAFALVGLLPSFAWASDTVNNRSYLRNELCGAGTTYACPAADIPIPRRGGIHIDPEGAATRRED